MATLRRIFVFHKTSRATDAQTDASFQLIASTPGVNFIAPFPNLPHDEREKGRTDQYTFDVSGNRTPVDSDNTEITMEMTSSSNGWLPESIWVLGETTSGRRLILGQHPNWRGGWFDRGNDAAGPDKHVISN